jgi:hypothetical protein
MYFSSVTGMTSEMWVLAGARELAIPKLMSGLGTSVKKCPNFPTQSYVWCHVCDTKHKIAWENSKLITTNNRYGQRRCLEAWHINMSNHALNRDDGAYLPEEYMHLIGR